jgi:hypothetical protein
MTPGRTISSTFWLMVIVQTIGSTDIFTAGPRKLPAPKQFVAIGVLWSIFHLFEGSRYERLFSSLSVLVVLAAVVLGPFGGVALGFLSYVASRFSLAPAGAPGGGGSSSLSPPPPGTTSIRPRGANI